MCLFFFFVDSWVSWVLLTFICLLALDIFVLSVFIIYMIVKWCRRNELHPILREEETINYDNSVSIQTKPVPVVFEQPLGLVHGNSEESIKEHDKRTSSEAFNVPMYFSEISKRETLENVLVRKLYSI